MFFVHHVSNVMAPPDPAAGSSTSRRQPAHPVQQHRGQLPRPAQQRLSSCRRPGGTSAHVVPWTSLASSAVQEPKGFSGMGALNNLRWKLEGYF